MSALDDGDVDHAAVDGHCAEAAGFGVFRRGDDALRALFLLKGLSVLWYTVPNLSGRDQDGEKKKQLEQE